MSLFGGEPQAGATPSEAATPPALEPQEATTPDVGLMGEYENARRALVDAQLRMNQKGAKIDNATSRALTRLSDLGLLPSDSGEARGSGMLVGRDGSQLHVEVVRDGRLDYITFDDVADPVRREVQIGFNSINLIAKEGGIGIDEVQGHFAGGVRRTDFAKNNRRDIISRLDHARLRGDLDRDILDAAADGLAVILDPGTTLKPAEAVPPTPTAQPTVPQPTPTTT